MEIDSTVLKRRIGHTKFWKYHLAYRNSGSRLYFRSADESISETIFYDDGNKFIYSNMWFTIIDIETNPTIIVKHSFSIMPRDLLTNCNLDIVFPERLEFYAVDNVNLGYVNKLTVNCKSLFLKYKITCEELIVSKNTEHINGVSTKYVILNDASNFKCADKSFYQRCKLKRLIINQANKRINPPFLCRKTEEIDLYIDDVYEDDLSIIETDHCPNSLRIFCRKYQWSFFTDAFMVKVRGRCICVNENHKLNRDFI